MRTVNKNLIVTAGLAFALALGGCSTSSQTTTTSSVSTDEGTTTTTTTTTKDESGKETTTTTTESAGNPSGAKAWTNDYFGVAFEPPANWTMVATSDEALNVNSNFKALMNDAIPLMAASDSETKDAVLVSRVEPSDATKSKTAEERVKTNAEADKKAMEEVGLKVDEKDATITLGSDELPAKVFELTTEDGTKSYFLQSSKKGADGDFLDIIIISSKEESLTQSCAYFKSLA